LADWQNRQVELTAPERIAKAGEADTEHFGGLPQ
jgi:hypothetical protein